jgi:hypothetical protein
MRRAQFLRQERRLATEWSLKYKGSASIKIEVLHFPYEESREQNEKETERLKNLFQRQEAVDRLDLRNLVPAVIDEQQLVAAMAASGVSAESMFADPRDSNPKLDFPAGFRLACLHGRHRVLAGAKTLPLGNKRWTVDLYLDGKPLLCVKESSNLLLLTDLNYDLKTTLIEEYSCEKKPDDGEIYHKIREYQGYYGAGNPYFEKRWWARLYAISKHKWDNLKQILRHPDYRAAFDIQLDIPGLGGGMRLSTSHKMFAARCHDVRIVSASVSNY